MLFGAAVEPLEDPVWPPKVSTGHVTTLYVGAFGWMAGASMAIGELRCVVIDVEDLGVAERFWSEVTGLPVIPS